MPHDTAIFLSDVHLGLPVSGGENREEALIAFLKEIQGRIDHLFLLGDIFDFWIEYRHVIRSDYFNILHALKNLAESGVRLHYLAGNHDFALGPFLSRTLGMMMHGEELKIDIQGKRLLVSHGDRYVETGAIHTLICHMLRNRRNQKLFKLLHPTIGIQLAERLSGLSRKAVDTGIKPSVPEAYRKIGRQLLESELDMVILAHTHYPEIIENKGKVYVNTGAWIKTCCYAELKQGELGLWEYLGPGNRRQIGNSFPLTD